MAQSDKPNSGKPNSGKSKPKPTGRARTASRLAAVQALFQSDQMGDNAETVIDQFIRHRLGDLPGPGGAPPGYGNFVSTTISTRLSRRAPISVKSSRLLFNM